MRRSRMDGPLALSPHALPSCLIVLVLMAMPGPSAIAEEKLGRLFFTPERREMLDRQRQYNIQDPSEDREDPMLTINGVVTRSSGKRTVWVNGVPQDGTNAASAASVIPNRKDPGKVVVRTSELSTAQAKVGETLNRDTGEAADLLGGGRISIRPGGTR